MSDARPAAGVRYAVVRDEDASDESTWIYRGFVHMAERDVGLEVRVALPGGATTAKVEGGDAKLESAAAALVRAATKQAALAGALPPRKIVRWRG